MSGLLRFLARRAALGAVTLLAIVTLSFFLQRAAPGGPFDDDRELDPAARAARVAEWRLDRPVAEQYLHYVAGLLAFPPDLKRSMRQPEYGVAELVAPRLAVSASLGAAALGLALALAVPAGVVAALRKNRVTDHAVTGAALLFAAVPSFVVGPLLKRVFAIELGWLPESRWTGPPSMVLPAVALAAGTMAVTARLVRAGMLDVLEEDWIRTARAKGLPPRLVVLRHALRGALVPLAGWLGPATAALVTGSVVVERVFAIPGLGSTFVDAAFNRDYTLVMGVVLVYSAILVVANVAADLLLLALDPRARTAS